MAIVPAKIEYSNNKNNIMQLKSVTPNAELVTFSFSQRLHRLALILFCTFGTESLRS